MPASQARRARREQIQVQDGFTESVHNVTSRPKAHGHHHHENNLEFYLENWLAGRIADCLSEDMTREGIKIHGLTDDQQSEILQVMTDWGAWEKITESKRMAYIEGGCGLWIDIDGQDQKKPLNLNSIKTDNVTLHSRDSRDFQDAAIGTIKKGRDFGLPEYYRDSLLTISGKQAEIHYSRVIRFSGISLPLRELQAGNFWGKSLYTRSRSIIDNYEQARTTGVDLLRFALIRGLKVKGLKELVDSGKICANGTPNDKFTQYLTALSQLQDYTKMTVIDSESDLVNQSISFAGIPEIAREQLLAVSGTYAIPMTRLIGQAPAGLNATGESDEKIYKSTIKQRQENELRQQVTTIVTWAHYALYGKPLPREARIEFNPLETPSALEIANTVKAKAEAVSAYVNGANILWDEEEFTKELGVTMPDGMGDDTMETE